MMKDTEIIDEVLKTLKCNETIIEEDGLFFPAKNVASKEIAQAIVDRMRPYLEGEIWTPYSRTLARGEDASPILEQGLEHYARLVNTALKRVGLQNANETAIMNNLRGHLNEHFVQEKKE